MKIEKRKRVRGGSWGGYGKRQAAAAGDINGETGNVGEKGWGAEEG